MATTSTTPPPEQSDLPGTGRLDGASMTRIVVIVTTIVLLSEVSSFQNVMVGAALQKMTPTFHVGADINWAVIISGVVGAATTPLLGKCSDLWGKKRIFLFCGVMFLIGSLIDAMTSSWALFLVGRACQAFSIAMLMISYGLVRDLLPRKQIPIALGVVGGGVGFSGLLGPIIAGLIVDNFHWRALFWFLVIYAAVMMVVFAAIVPETSLRVRQRIQPFGVLLLSAGICLVLLYAEKGQDWGWSRTPTLGWLVGGLVLLVAFYLVESRSSTPIMDMKLLADPRVGMTLLFALFGVGILAVDTTAMGYMTQTPTPGELKDSVVQGVIAQAHQMAGVSIPPSAVQVTLDPGYHYGSGFSLLGYALHIGIWAGTVSMIFGPVAGYLCRRVGARVPALVACVLMAAVSFGFALTTPHYGWLLFAVLNAVFGVGFVFFYAAASVLTVDGLPEDQQGIGSGMLGVTLSLGAAIGTAIMAAFQAANPVKAHIQVMGRQAVQPIPQVFADRGYVLTFWVMGALVLVALVIALIMRHGRKPSTAGIIVP